MSPRAARPESDNRSASAGDGGPLEAAQFIAASVSELAQVSRRHRLDTLGFLLDMALLEAEEMVRLHGDRRKA